MSDADDGDVFFDAPEYSSDHETKVVLADEQSVSERCSSTCAKQPSSECPGCVGVQHIVSDVSQTMHLLAKAPYRCSCKAIWLPTFSVACLYESFHWFLTPPAVFFDSLPKRYRP